MAPSLIDLGSQQLINGERIVAISRPDSVPMRRLIREYQKVHKVVDLTRGRPARSVIVTDAGFLVLCPLRAQTLARRFLALGRER